MTTQLRTAALASLSAALLIVTAPLGMSQPPQAETPPEINKPFVNPDVKTFVERFESESREVSAHRDAIVAMLGLKRGMTVADVGAGTGLFTRLIAKKVGPEGKVLAVDIAENFLKHIASESKRLGQSQVVTVLGEQTDAKLAAGSVDLIYLCDVYHHVEKPTPWLASLHRALKKDGRLVLIEFDRDAPEARSDFVKKHVRADKATFLREFQAAGFEPIELTGVPKFKENFVQAFRRVEPRAGGGR